MNVSSIPIDWMADQGWSPLGFVHDETQAQIRKENKSSNDHVPHGDEWWTVRVEGSIVVTNPSLEFCLGYFARDMESHS